MQKYTKKSKQQKIKQMETKNIKKGDTITINQGKYNGMTAKVVSIDTNLMTWKEEATVELMEGELKGRWVMGVPMTAINKAA